MWDGRLLHSKRNLVPTNVSWQGAQAFL
jgi:hypothetical protein